MSTILQHAAPVKKTAAEVAKAARDRMTRREKANIAAREAKEKADRKARGLPERTARKKITIQIPTGGLLAKNATRAELRKAAAKALGIPDWNETAKANTAAGRKDVAIGNAVRYGLRGVQSVADHEATFEPSEGPVGAKTALTKRSIVEKPPLKESHAEEAPVREVSTKQVSSKEAVFSGDLKNVTPRLSPFVRGIPDPPLIIAARDRSKEQADAVTSKEDAITREGTTSRENSINEEGAKAEKAAILEQSPMSRERTVPKDDLSSQESRLRAKERPPGTNFVPKEALTSENAPATDKQPTTLKIPIPKQWIVRPENILVDTVGRLGRHSAIKGHWNFRQDGLWTFTWDGGLAKGFDVEICLFYVCLEP